MSSTSKTLPTQKIKKKKEKKREFWVLIILTVSIAGLSLKKQIILNASSPFTSITAYNLSFATSFIAAAFTSYDMLFRA